MDPFMVEGFYSIAFRGRADWGMGVLVLYDGIIAGSDVGGVSYDGFYRIENDKIIITITLTVPAGAALVQGIPPQANPYSFKLDVTFYSNQLSASTPILVQTVYGPVNVIFKKLRNFPDAK
jgi:hypothetical protein